MSNSRRRHRPAAAIATDIETGEAKLHLAWGIAGALLLTLGLWVLAYKAMPAVVWVIVALMALAGTLPR